jgi:hypothetical protein
VAEDLVSEGFFGADMGGILQELDARGKDITRSAKLDARFSVASLETHALTQALSLATSSGDRATASSFAFHWVQNR